MKILLWITGSVGIGVTWRGFLTNPHTGCGYLLISLCVVLVELSQFARMDRRLELLRKAPYK